MNNFERIRLFHDYTCEAPFEGVLDAIEVFRILVF